MKIEIDKDELGARVITFWTMGDKIALELGRPDLVLTPKERLIHAQYDLIQGGVKKLLSNAKDMSREELECLLNAGSELKERDEYITGRKKMDRFVEEVLKSG